MLTTDNAIIEKLKYKFNDYRNNNLLRQRYLRNSSTDVIQNINHQTLISFASNDYLGLSHHPDVIKAYQAGAQTYGVGSGASFLINGYTKAHHLLSEALAEFLNRDVMLFTSGFQANIALITTLLSKNDVLLQDKFNHASLIDAGLYSGAKCHRFRHNDLNHLQFYLEKYKDYPTAIVTDGVFSMQGDEADLTGLNALSRQYNTLLIIDDAHGIGLLGKNSQGSVEHQNVPLSDHIIQIGTFGKAFGGSGAFIAASPTIIQALKQFARPYIYTTGLPPAMCMAMIASLHLIKSNQTEKPSLFENIDYFKRCAKQHQLTLLPSNTPIQPLLTGDLAYSLTLYDKLKKRGFFTPTIRPPTVPSNQCRLRITINAKHTKEQLTALVQAVDQS